MKPPFEKSATSSNKDEKIDTIETSKEPSDTPTNTPTNPNCEPDDKETVYIKSVILPNPKKRRNVKRWASNFIGIIFTVYLIVCIVFTITTLLARDWWFGFAFVLLALVNLFFVRCHIKAKQVIKNIKNILKT